MPVAVDLDDDLRRRTGGGAGELGGEPPRTGSARSRRPAGRSAARARSEPASDRVEARPVELARRPTSAKRGIAAGAAREDAQVESLGERVPLAGEARVERQPEARRGRRRGPWESSGRRDEDLLEPPVDARRARSRRPTAPRRRAALREAVLARRSARSPRRAPRRRPARRRGRSRRRARPRRRRRPGSRSRASRPRAPRRARVREVLPRRGEERRRRPPRRARAPAPRGSGAEEAGVAEPLERRAVRPVAGDQQLDAGRARRLDPERERLLGGQPAREDERRAARSRSVARSSSRGASSGSAGAGLGSSVTRSGATPQPSASSRR